VSAKIKSPAVWPGIDLMAEATLGVVTLTFHSVIPGRPKGEPGISRHNLQIPGSPLSRRPGMTPGESFVRGTTVAAFMARK
jgi:hypothetical protein